MKITGLEAIEVAEALGVLLCKYGDPIEESRSGLTPDEARDIARQDPSLIYLQVGRYD